MSITKRRIGKSVSAVNVEMKEDERQRHIKAERMTKKMEPVAENLSSRLKTDCAMQRRN